MSELRKQTSHMNSKNAFVAMKFNGDHWKDKRYLVIRDILKEAGYDPIRSDQIKTSGSVVDEVCRYFKEAPLVVIDSTGDSHSVSYEIGYCHGIARAPEKTILLRQGSDIPFNYRHFRNLCYKNLKHLRRLLRDWLNVIVPLKDDHFGYTFSFEVLSGASDYGAVAAECLLQSLKKFKFSGRAEFFASDARFGKDAFYMLGLGLRFTDKPAGQKFVPDYNWWMKFRSDFVSRVHKANCFLKHADTMSEMNELGAQRQNMLLRGVAQFEKGIPWNIIGGDSMPEGSWILMAIHDSMQPEKQIEA